MSDFQNFTFINKLHDTIFHSLSHATEYSHYESVQSQIGDENEKPALPDIISYTDKISTSTIKLQSKVSEDSLDETTRIEQKNLEMPTVFYYADMKNLLCLKLDRTLTLFSKDELLDYNKYSSDLTPLPKFIVYLVFALRKKFEEELLEDKCFLEAKDFPSNRNVVKLSNLVYIHPEKYSKIEKITKRANGILIFCALLELLQKFENKLLQFSEDTYKSVENNPIHKDIRPFDFVIKDQLNNYIEKVFTKIETVKRRKKSQKRGFSSFADPLTNLIRRYYQENSYNYEDDIMIRNTFHCWLYKDFRSTQTTMQRYLMKFILRSALYFVRRYICVQSAKLRRLRHESLDIAKQTCIPQIQTFAVNRMAQFLSFSITEIIGLLDSVESRMAVLKDIFHLHLDTIYTRQQRASNLIKSLDPAKCHLNCICGLG